MIAEHARGLLITGAIVMLAGCGAEQSPGNAHETPVTTAADLQRVSQLRIVFGHQSVGYNLISGIESLARADHTPLNISETREPFADAPGFHHFQVGHNEAPATKIADFDAVMRSGVAQSADVAMMKLCYVDFGPQVQPAPQVLARSYVDELDKLSAEYPQTVFVPMTAPLTTVQTGAKAWIKKALGRMPAGYEVNERRQQFNRVLREHYAGKDVLFDIAALESQSGKVSVTYKGESIQAMNPAYTTDGGHLNALGQKVIGGALVHHLASLSHSR